MIINLVEFKNAKNGDILQLVDGKWTPVNVEVLIKRLVTEVREVSKLAVEIEQIKNDQKHLAIYSKSHFLNIFTLFLTRVMLGDIDCADDELLTLDDSVISGRLTVKDAIEKHPFIKKYYSAAYLSSDELISYKQI